MILVRKTLFRIIDDPTSRKVFIEEAYDIFMILAIISQFNFSNSQRVIQESSFSSILIATDYF